MAFTAGQKLTAAALNSALAGCFPAGGVSSFSATMLAKINEGAWLTALGLPSAAPGGADGLAVLDSGGQVPAAQIPAVLGQTTLGTNTTVGNSGASAQFNVDGATGNGAQSSYKINGVLQSSIGTIGGAFTVFINDAVNGQNVLTTDLSGNTAVGEPGKTLTLSGTAVAATAAPGTNTTQVATTAFVAAAAASVSGKFSQLTESIKTANYTIQSSDVGTMLTLNSSSSRTLTLPASASVSGKPFFFRNIGSGDLVLDGNGSEQIEGATTLTLHQGCYAELWAIGGSSGTTWRAAQINRPATTAEAQAGTATGVYMDPAGTAAAIAAQQTLVQRDYAEYTTFATLTAAIPIDDTTPLVTEGTQILSLSYTPKSSSNIIRITATCLAGFANPTTQSSTTMAIFQGSTLLNASSASAPGLGYLAPIAASVEVSAGSTSSRTYSVRVGNNNTNTFVNGSAGGRVFGGGARAVLIIEEFTP